MTTPILPPSALPGQPVAATSPARDAGRWLVALADPEWLPCLAVSLAPAAAALALGDGRKASFFFGAAVYVAVLKWLGWAAFGRWSPARPCFLLLPAELFAGLAVACAWFYGRNALGAVWPASYGLGELAVLAPLLVVLHLLAGGIALVARLRSPQGWRPVARETLTRTAVLASFWGTLAVILWRVSDSLNPQTIDPIFHACVARAYVETGLFRPHPFLNTLYYPSGFGAVNAVAMSVAPLSAAQAVNLQHVLWQVTSLYLLAGTVLILAGRRAWAAGLLPVAFLLIVPLYSLYPDNCYSGTPRQMAVALLAAVGALPLLVAPQGAAGLVGGAVVGFLGVLAAAMNPACVPFAAFALLAALVVLVLRTRAAQPGHLLRQIVLQTGLVAMAAALVLACDPYYGRRLLERQAPTAGPAAEETPEAPRVPAGAIWDEVFLLARNRTATPAPSEQLSWPEHWPYVAFPIAALAAMAAAVGLTARWRLRGLAVPTGVVALNRFVIGCAAAWLMWKPAALALCELLPAASPEWQMLRAYLGFMLLRWELVLLFAGACAAGCVLALFADQLRREGRMLVRFGWWLGVVLTLWVATQRWPQCGDFIMPTARLFTTTPDDLALVAWCDENIPPERGLIGMAAATGRGGARGEEKHLVGLRGMPAFLLHGKRGNYCFTLNSLEGTKWYDDYRSHVETSLDTAWCAANGIRYFYVTLDGRRKNPGLDKAVEAGTLRLLHHEGDSGIYEVVEEAR